MTHEMRALWLEKAAPVEYVKVCPTYGPGFFYIPGTTTCIRVGGMAEFQGYGINKYTSRDNSSTLRQGMRTDAVNSEATARVFLDARDQTEYGMLRTFVRVNITRSSGSDDNSGSQPRRGQWFSSTGGTYQNLQTGFSGDEAFVQLGGFLAGRTLSFSSAFLPSVQETMFQPSITRVNQVGYTFSLGSGMSLSAAVEDAAEYRNGVFGLATQANNQNYNVASAASPTSDNTVPNTIPDAVASFDVAQSWGTLKVAGVVHEVQGQPGTSVSSKTGYQALTSAKINLPMIAAGDYLYVFADYGLGTSGRTLGATTNTGNSNKSTGMGNALWGVYDAVLVNGALSLSKTYSFGGEFKHYFAPTVAAYVGGTYWNQSFDAAARQPGTTSGADPKNGNEWGTALGVVWSPVSGLEINPEVAYRKVNVSSDHGLNNGFKTGVKSDDQYIGRLRVARSF